LGQSTLGRVFAVVIVKGHDLSELLVANGGRASTGTRTTLFRW
jgi:hypothetical protein